MVEAFIDPVFANLVIVVIVAVVLLGLLIWGAKNPLVWRILSVFGMGTGAGFLVWGIMLASTRQEPPIGSAAGIIAVGAGTLVSAIVLLVISFCGGCRRG